MKEIKVCLVSDTIFDVNGVSRFIQDFELEARNAKKNFLILGSTNKIGHKEYKNITNIKPLFKIRMPFYKSLDLVLPNYFKIKKFLKKEKPDLLHISTPGPVGLCALIAGRKLAIPIVGIYHTDFPSYLYKNTKSAIIENLVKRYLKKFYKNFEALFSRTAEYKEIISKDLNFSLKNIYTLKAGIDTKNFSHEFKNKNIWDQYNIKEKDFKVLYVGRVSLEKNIDKLISFWSEAKFKDIKLFLVGDLEFKLYKKSLEEKGVYILGRKQKKELSTLYASCDCFIFPSTTDTLGQVVLEALSSSKPVLVTNKGGPKSFVKKEFGYILDLEDGKSWKKALEELALKDEKYFLKCEKAYEFMQTQTISKSFEDFWKKNEIILKKLEFSK